MQEQDKQISFVDKWLCHLTSAHVTGHTITYAYLDSTELKFRCGHESNCS